MYYVVLLRSDSISDIHQRIFETYKEAKSFFDSQKEFFFFRKLCVVIQDDDED